MTHDTTPIAPDAAPSDPAPGFRLQMEDVRVRFGPPALDGLTLDLVVYPGEVLSFDPPAVCPRALPIR